MPPADREVWAFAAVAFVCLVAILALSEVVK